MIDSIGSAQTSRRQRRHDHNDKQRSHGVTVGHRHDKPNSVSFRTEKVVRKPAGSLAGGLISRQRYSLTSLLRLSAPVVVYPQPVCVTPAAVVVVPRPYYYAPPLVKLNFGFGHRPHSYRHCRRWWSGHDRRGRHGGNRCRMNRMGDDFGGSYSREDFAGCGPFMISGGGGEI
jgi:hypothetical protein